MNVTLRQFPGQAGLRRQRRRSLFPALGLAALALINHPARAETHANLQAVNADGTSAWTPAFPYTIRGVLLCNPDGDAELPHPPSKTQAFLRRGIG